jgi:DNA-binding response OmpR family regulator
METIILQEKDGAILDILTIALQMEGFKVCALSACDETLLKLIDRHRPNAVILGYEFEDRTCIQMRHRIKELHSHLDNVQTQASSE